MELDTLEARFNELGDKIDFYDMRHLEVLRNMAESDRRIGPSKNNWVKKCLKYIMFTVAVLFTFFIFPKILVIFYLVIIDILGKIFGF